MTTKFAGALAAMAMAAGLTSGPALAETERGQGHAYGHDRQEEREAHGNAPEHAGRDAAAPPPGQAKEEGAPAQPGHAAEPGRKPRPARPAKPAKPADPGPAVPANPHAKAGKTTICHATGSATNPYVAITISDNALPAHARHQDGRDLIPAPAGGCPQAAAAAPARRDAGAIDGAPAEAESAPEAAARTAATAPAVPLPGTVALAERGQVRGVFIAGDAFPRLREALTEPPSTERRETGASAPRAVRGGELPFTGLEALLLALSGLALVLFGILVRHVSSRPAY